MRVPHISYIFLLLFALSGCKREKEAIADFSFSKDNEVSPCTVTFVNLCSDADQFHWDFGDGRTSSLKDPTHTYYRSGSFKVILTANNQTSSSARETTITVAPGGIEITAVPVSLGLNPFYKKYTDANGIPVISSAKVPEEALLKARSIVIMMLGKRDDVRLKMIEYNARVGIIGASEVTTDMPEYAFLKNDPNTNWDERARGLGGTIWVPLTTGAEENILCYTNDRYKTEDILIHEFAHALHGMGIKFVENDFETRLNNIFTNAINSGKWLNTYAATNIAEYWAEGVQSWFNVNAQSSPPNGIHNHVNTRNELLQYDPDLHNLISEFLNESLTGSCHQTK